jgi:hypothetical protein
MTIGGVAGPHPFPSLCLGLAGWWRSFFCPNGVVRFRLAVGLVVALLWVDCASTSEEKWWLNDCMVGGIGECIYRS